jgi:hypothetical protein
MSPRKCLDRQLQNDLDLDSTSNGYANELQFETVTALPQPLTGIIQEYYKILW